MSGKKSEDLVENDDLLNDLDDIDDVISQMRADDDDDFVERKASKDELEHEDEDLQEIVFEVGGKGDNELEDDWDDDFQKPQTSVEKRIHRERRKKEEVNRRLEAVARNRDELYGRLSAQEAATIKARRDGALISKRLLSDEQALLQTIITKGKEYGDDVSAYETKLLEVREGLRVADSILSEMPNDETLQRHQSRAQIVDAGTRVPPKTRDWIDNNPWFNSNMAAREYALIKDRELAAAGSDINSDAHMLKLTREVARRFPELEVYTHDGRIARIKSDGSTGTGAERRRGGAGRQDVTSGGRGGKTTSSKGKLSINRDEASFLKRMGLDLTDPEVRKEYARNAVRK